MKLRERIRLYPRTRRGDARGWLLKCLDGHEAGLPPNVGEVYVVMALSGQVRGAHYHRVAHEWFTPLQGRATLLLADPVDGERLELEFAADHPQTVHVPPGIAHAFRAERGAGDVPSLLCAYSDQRYAPDDTIPFAFE
jgi:dTDP-4-dehydrorhamnose 3,5-epimerase-like enzyme